MNYYKEANFNEKAYKEKFKDHVATFNDYGNIKVLDFKREEDNYYRIRFLFEEDYCRLHISGDLGDLTAQNYSNMTYEKFHQFVGSKYYFKEKIVCHSRLLYYYDVKLAEKQLRDELKNCSDEEDFEVDLIDILDNFDMNKGLTVRGYDLLYEYDSDCWEYSSSLGKVETDIIDVYLLAFKLATEQLGKE